MKLKPFFMTFETYLQARKYSASTVKRYTDYVARFVAWLQTEDIPSSGFAYNDLLAFIKDLQDRDTSKQTQSLILCAVRHYADYLQSTGMRTDNPATGLYLKGRERKLPVGLLSHEEMEELYHQYSVQLHVEPVKKIMLGLLIFQGVTVGELLNIKRQHIRLQEGKITITATRSANPRTLALQGCQTALLMDHLRRIASNENIFSFHRKHNLHNQVQYMFDQLRKLNPRIINAKQIRGSVITEWLRTHPLREVQYMAGHKYVSSTERYQLTIMDDLKNEIAVHHPMR